MTDPSFRSAWGMQEPRKSMYWNRPDLLREELIGRERLRLDAERRHLEGLQTGAMAFAVGSALAETAGAYYAADAQRGALQAEESALRFQANVGMRNSAQAELDALSILETSRLQVGEVSVRQEQQAAQDRIEGLAAGQDQSYGSSAEAQVSTAWQDQIERDVIVANAARSAGAARVQATNLFNEATMNAVSADTMRRQRRAINPTLAAIGAAVSGAGSVMSTYASFQPGMYPYPGSQPGRRRG